MVLLLKNNLGMESCLSMPYNHLRLACDTLDVFFKKYLDTFDARRNLAIDVLGSPEEVLELFKSISDQLALTMQKIECENKP